MARPQFFIIFSPTGPTPPVVMYSSHTAAFGVAHRMAAEHPGQDFHVMASASRAISTEGQVGGAAAVEQVEG